MIATLTLIFFILSSLLLSGLLMWNLHLRQRALSLAEGLHNLHQLLDRWRELGQRTEEQLSRALAEHDEHWRAMKQLEREREDLLRELATYRATLPAEWAEGWHLDQNGE